jgi:parvulin-like peptidyl-prolyl isomerase
MKRSSILLIAAATAISVTACDSVKDAFTAHVDTVARAGGQELSTERLAKLMANAQIPIQKDVAGVVANLWVSYQLLAQAGAHGDSLTDAKTVDAAMWAMIDNAKAQKFYETAKKKFPTADTTALEQKYAQGRYLAAQHILFMMPENGAGLSQKKQDSIKDHAEAIRKQVTSANFSEMAKKYTEEPGGKERNGSLGVFPAGPGGMVPEFESAVKALKPGEVSPALVRTNYGFHIVRRNLLSEVHDQFVNQIASSSEGDASKKYVAGLEADYKLRIDSSKVGKARDAVKDPDAARNDKTVLASSRHGDFTAGRLAKWIQAFPPQSNIRQQLAQAPDSVMLQFVRSLAGQELIVAEADKNNVKPDSGEINQVRAIFKQMVGNTAKGLRVDPASLDSAKSQSEKEHLASSRVEEALDQLFASNGANFIDMPQQLASALRDKYSARVNSAGLDRAVERAQAMRAQVDSARAKAAPQQQPGGGVGIPDGAVRVPVPPSAMPMPGPPPRGGSGRRGGG